MVFVYYTHFYANCKQRMFIMKKNKTMFRVILTIAIVLIVCGLGYICWYLFNIYTSGHEYENLQQPTNSPTEKPTEKPTKPATKLPYTDSLGKIENYDFAWISDAMSGSLDGSFLSKDELLGKWKGEFIFDGIWELVYVTIDTDGTVTVQPYKINYGDGWEDESGNPSYDFSGSFDINRVYGSGGYGKIDIYQFIESGGTQYGIGELKTTSGNKEEVYLVRP